MALTHSETAQNAIADAVVDLIDAGAGAGKLKIYDSAVLLATLTMSDPAFGPADEGTATADTITGATAVADGTADKFVLTDSDDNSVVEGTVSESGGGGDCIITNTDINVDDPITCSSLTYSAPANP